MDWGQHSEDYCVNIYFTFFSFLLFPLFSRMSSLYGPLLYSLIHLTIIRIIIMPIVFLMILTFLWHFSNLTTCFSFFRTSILKCLVIFCNDFLNIWVCCGTNFKGWEWKCWIIWWTLESWIRIVIFMRGDVNIWPS